MMLERTTNRIRFIANSFLIIDLFVSLALICVVLYLKNTF